MLFCTQREKLILIGILFCSLVGTLVGTLETPNISFLYNCQPLSCSPNADSIVLAIDDAVRSLGTNRNSFGLLLPDTARYLVGGGRRHKSKILVPKLLHVTCIAHLLHNCASKE